MVWNALGFTAKKTVQHVHRIAVWTRLELATSAVTGRHSNQTELPDLRSENVPQNYK